MTKPRNDFPWLGRPSDSKLLAGQIFPRAGQLVFDRQWFFVLPVAVFFSCILLSPLAESLLVKDVAQAEVSLASLSFGACVTGTILTLNLNEARARAWAVGRRDEHAKFSHFSDLLFVFIWSGLCQLAVVFSAFVSIAVGAGKTVYVHREPVLQRMLVAIAVLTATYAYFQLIAVLRTLAQVGAATITMLTTEHLSSSDEEHTS